MEAGFGGERISIKGVQKSSLVDYPDRVCAVVFLADCNFRCGFCQNPDLINHAKELPEMPESEFFEMLSSRGKWLDAVCVSGGEPSLHPGLPAFLKRIKEKGFLVKLDTNGTNPRMLKKIIEEGNVDYLAMDIKAPINRYEETAGVPVDIRKIEESIRLIQDSGIEYEFRTTVLPRHHTHEDIRKIGQWLHGSRRYAIQQFRPGNTLDPSYNKEETFPAEELQTMKKSVEKNFKLVEVRNI